MMVSSLVIWAEAANAISGLVIVSCLLLVTMLIMRYQGDLGGGSSVVHLSHQPVQVAVQKLRVPYTLKLLHTDSNSVRVSCGSIGQACRVVWWWALPQHLLMPLLHDTWHDHHDTVSSPPQHWQQCPSHSQVVVEGDHELELPVPDHLDLDLDLGTGPRTVYPLVLVQLHPLKTSHDTSHVGSVVSVVHLPDTVYREPGRVLYQYLKQRTGQLTLLTALFTQSNGVTTVSPSSFSDPSKINKEELPIPPVSNPVPTSSGSLINKDEDVATYEESSTNYSPEESQEYNTAESIKGVLPDDTPVLVSPLLSTTKEGNLTSHRESDSDLCPVPKCGQLDADDSHLAASPDDSHLAASPDDSDLAASPNDSSLTALPDDSHLTALPDDSDLAASPDECVVCQSSRVCLALLPCRHVCVCHPCFQQLMSAQQMCPLCRQAVTAYFMV